MRTLIAVEVGSLKIEPPLNTLSIPKYYHVEGAQSIGGSLVRNYGIFSISPPVACTTGDLRPFVRTSDLPFVTADVPLVTATLSGCRIA
ncbi:MAG TPA: hypothetical protein VKC60_16840 [Opitutaceae bacterium]|nr:hypothetical protein [Opitutaceae bacterium]